MKHETSHFHEYLIKCLPFFKYFTNFLQIKTHKLSIFWILSVNNQGYSDHLYLNWALNNQLSVKGDYYHQLYNSKWKW